MQSSTTSTRAGIMHSPGEGVTQSCGFGRHLIVRAAAAKRRRRPLLVADERVVQRRCPAAAARLLLHPAAVQLRLPRRMQLHRRHLHAANMTGGSRQARGNQYAKQVPQGLIVVAAQGTSSVSSD